ncbi:MAG: [FeFe] hydrogenase H-cluster maturation GTPase HydF [Capsulimonadaceae bacterium]|nr:[FeFe] hydrogenase H-cluster maturation GTPase HydF [Capsulimonadaceae bacterium]
MNKTPKSLRLHIGLFGRRNVGKSSLLNAITRQNVSIVSGIAGTTTDPVEKPMEMLPIGPVLFIDTAGIDDAGALGDLRVEKTRQVFDRTDLGIIVIAEEGWSDYEEAVLKDLKHRGTPVVAVFNKSDIAAPDPAVLDKLGAANVAYVRTAAATGAGILDLREALIKAAPEEFISSPPLIGDLIAPGDFVILVVPIDTEAPKGRLIMPQVQSIRDLLDNDACCMVVKERELRHAIENMKTPPSLVVTDSQAFLKVAADTPPEIPMTSFSILFSRAKGDLSEFVRGATAIDRLKSGSRILVAEACSHHPIGDDIGRVKIPRWLRQYVGGALEFEHYQGRDFPADLSPYDLIIHCGSCALGRREMLSRILHCRREGKPITNYGMCIAYTLGVFERALAPFPFAREAYLESRK